MTTSVSIDDRIVAFLNERPTHCYSRRGIASGLGILGPAPLGVLRRLVAAGRIKACRPARPALWQSVETPPVLTPSEVFAAKVVAEWDGWPGTDDDPTASPLCRAVEQMLTFHGYRSGIKVSALGHDLLSRARKAGVL